MVLSVLQTEIGQRCQTILNNHANWPCHAGCDHCCRNLADIPQITAPEWDQMESALAALPDGTRELVLRRTLAIEPDTRPIICPLLNQATGCCLVYEARPIACRTYGFYVERDKGLYCDIIHAAEQRGEMPEVVWGNAESVAAGQARLGPLQSIRFYLQRI